MGIVVSSNFDVTFEYGDDTVNITVTIPPVDVVSKIDELLNAKTAAAGKRIFALISSDPDLRKYRDVDIGEALKDPDVIAAVISKFGDDAFDLFGGVDSEAKRAAADSIREYCAEPVGLEDEAGHALTWDQATQRDSSFVCELLSRVASEVVTRVNGEAGKLRRKN